MTRAIITGIFWMLLLQTGLSQPGGGESTYNFLSLTNSAKVASLGGELVSLMDEDINVVFHNPALLTSGMHNNLNINYINYFAGINYGYTSYGYTVEDVGTFATGIQYVNYGVFDRTDELGVSQGTFRASEYALNLAYSRPFLDTSLFVGVILKPIFSSFEQYNSFGLAADLGIAYHMKKSLTTLGLVARNMGAQISSYTTQREKLPLEIHAGITQGLAHAPFRFNITYQHLERWDLTYTIKNDNEAPTIGEEAEKSQFDVFGDKLMRHMVFGVEFLIGENFHLDIGFNYKRRKEMKVNVHPGLVGFSAGFGFRISRFHMAFGHSAYHLAGGVNYFSLTTNFSTYYRKSD
jgi:hypothetical protein